MAILLFLACLCMRPLSAHARIGETEQQCVERYGRPIKRVEGRGILIFSKSGFRIAVHTHGDKVDLIIYTKTDREEISGAEIAILLNYNGSGWRNRPNDNHASYHWVAENGSARASYQTREHQLSIATVSYLDRSRSEHNGDR